MKRHNPVRLRALPGLDAERAGTPRGGGVATPAMAGAGAFCARCGQPPRGDRTPARVCQICGLGLVLVAAAGAAPRPSERFLIVDGQSTVSAVSVAAEALLSLSEEALLGRPVIDLVRPEGEQPFARHDFLASLRAAARGIGPLRRFQGWVGPSDGDQPRQLRVAPCGPPPGALLVIGDARG